MKTYRAIAEYYDPEGERLEMLQRDVPFLLSHLPKRPQDILELAVGTARAAIPLAQAGHRLTGIDYAPEMLAIARRKRDAVGLTDRELTLRRADILTLNLRAPSAASAPQRTAAGRSAQRKFDRIILLFNTFLGFTTLEQQDRALAAVRRHLKATGRFWLDIFHPDLALCAQPHSRDLDASVFHVPALDRTVFRSVDVRRDMSRQLMHVTFRYKWFDPHGRAHREKTTFDMTVIHPRELRLLLERNGFQIEHLWGDYDGSDLTAHSPRMIAQCRVR